MIINSMADVSAVTMAVMIVDSMAYLFSVMTVDSMMVDLMIKLMIDSKAVRMTVMMTDMMAVMMFESKAVIIIDSVDSVAD